MIQPQVTDPDDRQETHRRALITLPSSRFDKSISLCLTASAASPNVLGLSQGQAEGCRKPLMNNLCSLLRHPLLSFFFYPDLAVWVFWLVCSGFVKLFQLFRPDLEVVFVFFSRMKISIIYQQLLQSHISQAPPLLSQPSEPGVIQPQHVAALKCSTAVSGFIMSRCSEQKQQNIKSEAGFKRKRKTSQLNSAGRNSIKDRVSLDCREDSPLRPRWMSRLSRTRRFFFCGYLFLVIFLNAWLQRCRITGIEEALFENGLLSAFMCHFAVNWGSY